MSKVLNIENIAKNIFLLLGLVNVGFVLLICIYLIIAGLPAILKIGLIDFLFGTRWAPTSSTPEYGILPFILTSIYGTAGAIVLGLPVGFCTAMYLAKIAPKAISNVIEPLVDILAAIPSVIYGFIGMLVLVPWVQRTFNLADGSSLFAAIIVLSIMILPQIIKVSITAIRAVPIEYEHGALALGANKIESYVKIIIPAAKSGIAAAVVLGVARAIGEAMAIMMVAGNVANMPNLFDSVRFLTSAIATEMSYSHGLQQQALFSIALVLLVFIMMINAALNYFLKKGK